MDTQDFSIKIQPPRGRSYPVFVLDSPAGQGKGRLRLPSDFGELRYPWEEPIPDWNAFEREEDWKPERFVKKAEEVGGRLFKALFSGQIRQLYERSLGFLEARSGAGLRFRLHLDVSDPALARLATLPWELLFDANLGKFLSLDRRTPVVRALDLAQPGRPVELESPLRILIATAQPGAFPKLNLERERQRILTAWTEGRPALLDVLDHATPTALRDALLAGHHQVLHFLGHGMFLPGVGQGSLILEREDGASGPIPGPLIGKILGGLPEIRLVVLNACETARLQKDGRQPYSSVATALVQEGIPAVVAMNAPVHDRTAIAFSSRLYGRLSMGDPIEAAVTEARLAISAERPETVDWALPVLFLRGPGGAPVARQTDRELSAHTPSTWKRPFMPEQPPEDFVERPELIEPLIKSLLVTDDASTVGLAAAFRGAGGYGKTTLARAVCHDPRIRRAFPDGILWVTLGERPENLIGAVEDLIYSLSKERPGFSSLDAATASLASLLEPRRALIVIDDVWSSTHLRPFLRGGPRCARLVTTRDRTVLPTGANVVQVDAMQREESLRLLTGGLPDEQRPALESLAGRLGHWPLLLRLVNGVLRDRLLNQSQDLVGALLSVGAALDHHGLTAFDVADPGDRNRAVASTLAVSLDQLHPEARERFLDLAVFPEDTDVPFSALEKLWGSLAAIDVEALCVRLHQLSLLLAADLSRRFVRLHDVIRAFLYRQRMPALTAVHGRFLAAGRQGIEGVWRNLPAHETYLWRHLSYHLEAAGLVEELAGTVQDLGFLVNRVALGDPHGAEGDLVRAEGLAPANERLRALHAAFANAKHLLIPCKSPEEIIATFLSRLIAAAELRELVEAFERSLSRPPLRARFPFPDSPDPALLRTLASFGGQVNACGVSADGTRVVTACEDGSVILWDTLLGAELWTVHESPEIPEDEDLPVCDSYAALSADGSTLLAADFEGKVRVWDVATRVELCHFDEGGRIVSASLSADGRRGAYRSQSGRLRAFETAGGGRIILDAAVDISSQGSCALSADGSRLLATLGNKLCLWDLGSDGLPLIWPAQHASGTGCALTADGKRALSGSENATARLWDTATGKELQELQHGSEVYACALSSQGELAVTAGRDEAVILWDTQNGARRRSLSGHLGGVFSCAISGDGNLLVTGGGDLTAKLWRDPLRDPGPPPPFQAHLRDGAIDASGRLLAGATLNATLRIWNLETAEQILCLEHPQAVSGCALAPDGDFAVSVADDGGARVWNLATGECTILVENGPSLPCCALGRQGDLFAFAEYRGRVRVWDARERREITSFDGGSSVPTRCRFSTDDQHLLLSSRDGLVRMWNLSTDTDPQVVARHSDEVNGCAISADGTRIASASHDGTVSLWDRTGKLLLTLAEHTGPVRDCAFQPGGNLLVSVSTDIGVGSTIKLWDSDRGLCLASLRVDGELSTCGWLPGGTGLFAAGQYGCYLLDWQP